MSVKKIFPLLMVLALSCLILLHSGCRRENAAVSAERIRTQKVRAFWDKYRPKEIPSESERRSLAELFETVAIAYANGQVSVIRQCESLVSNRVVNLDHFEYESLSGGISRKLYENFLALRNLKKIEDFPSPQSLSDYLEVNLALVRFLGVAASERLGLDNPVDWWEGITLRNLKEYQRRTQTLGLCEYERVVDRFMAQWIDLIESEKGLTRTKLRRNMPVMLIRARMVGDYSADQVLTGLRAYVRNLTNCGYTPKWLDEFKVIPRRASPMEESSKK